MEGKTIMPKYLKIKKRSEEGMAQKTMKIKQKHQFKKE